MLENMMPLLSLLGGGNNNIADLLKNFSGAGAGGGANPTAGGGMGNMDMSAIMNALQGLSGGNSGGNDKNSSTIASLLPILNILMKANTQNAPTPQPPTTTATSTGENSPPEQAKDTVKYSKKAHSLEPVSDIADKQMIYLLNKYFSSLE